MASAIEEVGCYRTGMANLLVKLLEVVGENERRLDVAADGGQSFGASCSRRSSNGRFSDHVRAVAAKGKATHGRDAAR